VVQAETRVSAKRNVWKSHLLLIVIAATILLLTLRLTDHYNFRSVREPGIGAPNRKPKTLDDTGTWVNKFFDQNDIRCVEREVLA
jgi:hypothetical protein